MEYYFGEMDVIYIGYSKLIVDNIIKDYVSTSILREDITKILDEGFNNSLHPYANSLELHYKLLCENEEKDDLTDLSTCIELLMLTLDIIDDLQDLDNEEAVWSKMKHSSALNSSICIFTLLLLKLLEKRDGNTIQTILSFLLRSIEGQHEDINDTIHNTEQYLKITELKSGSLLAMANILGASMHTSCYNKIIEEYSILLGVSAQISNDIQDFTDFTNKSDWKLKKKTLPILYLLNPKIKEGEFIREYYNDYITYDEFISNPLKLENILTKSGALNFAITWKILYENRALNKIEELPISHDKKTFLKENLLNNNFLEGKNGITN